MSKQKNNNMESFKLKAKVLVEVETRVEAENLSEAIEIAKKRGNDGIGKSAPRYDHDWCVYGAIGNIEEIEEDK